MKKITKRRKATPVLKPELDEWKTLPDPQALEAMRAHIHPVRRIILTLLDIGTRVKDAGRILRVLSSSRKQIGRMRGSVKAIIGGLKA